MHMAKEWGGTGVGNEEGTGGGERVELLVCMLCVCVCVSIKAERGLAHVPALRE